MSGGPTATTDPPAPVLGRPGGHPTIQSWTDWIGTYTGIVVVTIALLPLAVLAVWALTRWRRRVGATPVTAWCRSAAEVGIVYGTLPWIAMTMLPGSEAGTAVGRVSLVPLQDLQTMPVYQIVGNLLIFAALGFLVPLRFAVLASLPRILAVAAAGSVLIETAQYVLSLDRVSSIDDVLLNTAGAGLAALASRRWWRSRPAAEVVTLVR